MRAGSYSDRGENVQLESTFARAEVCLLTELAEQQKIPLMRGIGICSKDRSTRGRRLSSFHFRVVSGGAGLKGIFGDTGHVFNSLNTDLEIQVQPR